MVPMHACHAFRDPDEVTAFLQLSADDARLGDQPDGYRHWLEAQILADDSGRAQEYAVPTASGGAQLLAANERNRPELVALQHRRLEEEAQLKSCEELLEKYAILRQGAAAAADRLRNLEVAVLDMRSQLCGIMTNLMPSCRPTGRSLREAVLVGSVPEAGHWQPDSVQSLSPAWSDSSAPGGTRRG